MHTIPRFRPSLSRQEIIAILKKLIAFSGTRRKKSTPITFESAFAEYLGVRNALSAPSGRMGLFLILKHLNLPKKSEIILPAFTYWAVPSIISALDLKPVFVDIDPATCNIDPAQIEKKITRSTRAIIPTHLYGLSCPMDEIIALAKRHNVVVIEDCVQACGATYKGKKVGSLGEAAYFSFGATKNMFLFGGGVVTTNNDDLAGRIRSEIASYGFVGKGHLVQETIKILLLELLTNKFFFPFLLFPFMRLSNLFGKDLVGGIFEEKKTACAELPQRYFKIISQTMWDEFGAAQLNNLDNLNSKRIENAKYLLESIPKSDGVTFPSLGDDKRKNIFMNFPLRVKNRTFVSRELLKRGVDSTSGYMMALVDGCPGATQLQQSIIHIPIYSSLGKKELSYLCEAIQEVFSKDNL